MGPGNRHESLPRRDAFERFEAARDQLAQQGGGVLYYLLANDFSQGPLMAHGRGLLLKRRGHSWRSTTSGSTTQRPLELATVFSFGAEVKRQRIGFTVDSGLVQRKTIAHWENGQRIKQTVERPICSTFIIALRLAISPG